jgi:hypothetical protein
LLEKLALVNLASHPCLAALIHLLRNLLLLLLKQKNGVSFLLHGSNWNLAT